jgi:predicted transposase/invertase (TIGR01784 family)
MTTTTDRYINLFTDFGFKKLFGEEPNKDLLISFLNALLGEEGNIQDLTYLKNERLGKSEGERKAVYDLYCRNEAGEKFIVEIQRVKQEFFKDRSLYYASFAIQDQAMKGREWQYELKGVYTIAVLDFEFDKTQQEKLEYRVKLVDTLSNEVFYNKLTFVYIEIPKFRKALSELSNDYERWLYAFKNLHRLREMPKELEEGVFKRLFELAEIASMEGRERDAYQESLKDYWDLKSSMDTYFSEGKEEGLKEGIRKGRKEEKMTIAKNALASGLSVATVAQLTGLSEAEIRLLTE